MLRRNRIPIEHRERIVRAFENEAEDYLLVADTLGVNRSTARGIVTRYVREGRIRETTCWLTKQRASWRLNEAVPGRYHQWELCSYTKPDKWRVEAKTSCQISDSWPDRCSKFGRNAVSRCKLVRPVPADRNRRDVLQRRQEYGNWSMNHAIMRHSGFIDECGYNIWTARNHGRARQGERAYRQVCGQGGRNVTVAPAVSPVNGLVFHSVSRPEIQARMDDRASKIVLVVHWCYSLFSHGLKFYWIYCSLKWMPDHAKEYSFDLIEFTMRAN